MNRWVRGLLIAAPSFAFVLITLVLLRLDISRTTHAVLIGVAAVLCVAALILIGVWLSRRSS